MPSNIYDYKNNIEYQRDELDFEENKIVVSADEKLNICELPLKVNTNPQLLIFFTLHNW